MKKLLFIAAILLFASACDNEDDTNIQLENSDLLGKWSSTSETDVENEIHKYTHTFDLDGSYEAVTTLNDQETEAIIGYYYKTEGSYFFKQDSLKFITKRTYSMPSDTDIYVENISDLKESDVFQTNTRRYSLTENKSKLILKFRPCKLNELCAEGYDILFKE